MSFSSWAVDLVLVDTNGLADAFLRDLTSQMTVRLSLGAAGNELFGDSFAAAVSTDGSIALFSSQSTAVTPEDTDGHFDAFQRDLASGAVALVSQGWIGGPSTSDSDFFPRDMTPDGRFACFSSAGNVFMRECPQQVARYGSAKPNSVGCYPWISWTGEPSSSAGAGFLVRVQGKLNQVPGLLIYGYQPAPTSPLLPFLLVGPPIYRLPGASTGGSTSSTDCTGTLQVDFNAWIGSGMDPMLAPGVTVYAQFWSRDSGFVAPANYGFSEALEITLLP